MQTRQKKRNNARNTQLSGKTEHPFYRVPHTLSLWLTKDNVCGTSLLNLLKKQLYIQFSVESKIKCKGAEYELVPRKHKSKEI